MSFSVVLSKTSTVHFTVTNARLRPTLFALPGFITAASGHQVGGEYIYLSQWFVSLCSLNFLLPKRRMLNGLPLLIPPLKKAPKGSSKVGALKVDAVVVTENWLVSNEAAAAAAAEEAMTLAKAAAMAASDAAAYAQAQSVTFDSQEFPSEMDLLRLERARLSEMERFQMVELDMEPDVSQTQNNYRNSQLGTMSDGSTAVANKATEALAVGLQTGV